MAYFLIQIGMCCRHVQTISLSVIFVSNKWVTVRQFIFCVHRLHRHCYFIQRVQIQILLLLSGYYLTNILLILLTEFRLSFKVTTYTLYILHIYNILKFLTASTYSLPILYINSANQYTISTILSVIRTIILSLYIIPIQLKNISH